MANQFIDYVLYDTTFTLLYSGIKRRTPRRHRMTWTKDTGKMQYSTVHTYRYSRCTYLPLSIAWHKSLRTLSDRLSSQEAQRRHGKSILHHIRSHITRAATVSKRASCWAQTTWRSNSFRPSRREAWLHHVYAHPTKPRSSQDSTSNKPSRHPNKYPIIIVRCLTRSLNHSVRRVWTCSKRFLQTNGVETFSAMGSSSSALVYRRTEQNASCKIFLFCEL